MSLWFWFYLAGATVVGGFFLGVQIAKPELSSNKETTFSLLLALIWPMALAGLAWAALLKWADRQAGEQ